MLTPSKKRTFTQFQESHTGRAIIDLISPCSTESFQCSKKQRTLSPLHHDNVAFSPFSISALDSNHQTTTKPLVLSISDDDASRSQPLEVTVTLPPDIVSPINKINDNDTETVTNLKSESSVDSVSNDETKENESIPSIDSMPCLEWLVDGQCIITQHRLHHNWYHFEVSKPTDCGNDKVYWLKHDVLSELSVYRQYLKTQNLSLDEVSHPQYVPERILDHQYNEECDEMEFHIKWKGYGHGDNTWETKGNLKNNDLFVRYCKTHNLRCSDSESDGDDVDGEDFDDDDDGEEVDTDHDLDALSLTLDHIDIFREFQVAQKLIGMKSINRCLSTSSAFTIQRIMAILNAVDHRMESVISDDFSASTLSTVLQLWNIRDFFEALKGDLLIDDNLSLSLESLDGVDAVNGSDRGRKAFSVDDNRRAKDSEGDTANMDHLRLSSSCYCCGRKWNLWSIEYFRRFPICKTCPGHIRLGHDRNLKEDWFCPLCIHSAKCHLFAASRGSDNDSDSDPDTDTVGDDRFGTNGCSLRTICSLKERERNPPTLYLKPKHSAFWKTYVVDSVNDEHRGDITVRDKKRGSHSNSKPIRVILDEVPSHHILWAFCCDQRNRVRPFSESEIKKIVAIDAQRGTVRIQKKTASKQMEVATVRIEAVIHSKSYFVKICTEKIKELRRRRIRFDRSVVFKFSQKLMRRKQKQKDAKKAAALKPKIIDSAPLNSRYFDDRENGGDLIHSVIPRHDEVEREWTESVAPTFEALSEVQSECRDRGPFRFDVRSGDRERLLMESDLILVLGPSGSGKTLFLKQLAAEWPSRFVWCGVDGDGHHRNGSEIGSDHNRVVMEWDSDLAVIDAVGMGMGTETAMELMSSIGLNSVRTWLKPYKILSQGEQYRATMARLLATQRMRCHQNADSDLMSSVLMMDDFGHVLDGPTARCMAAAVSKCLRAQHSKLVVASSNPDLVRYLQPDLVVAIDIDTECGRDRNGIRSTKWLQNEGLRNSINFEFKPEIKVIVDLPPFSRRKGDRHSLNHNDNGIGPRSKLQPQSQYIKEPSATVFEIESVLSFQCKVTMSGHAVTASRILDVDDSFDGETVSHIPCLRRKEVPSSFAIGVFLGSSGSGKTSSAERLFGRAPVVEWDPTRSVISHFQSTSTVKELFDAMALSVMLGLRHFETLSVGEQHRLNMARLFEVAALRASSSESEAAAVVIDEFTSSLDRVTAHKVAVGISRFVERHKLRRIVLLSCKTDIISSGALWPRSGSSSQRSWLFEVEQRKMTIFNASNHRIPTLISPQRESVKMTAFQRGRIRLVFRECNHRCFSPSFSKHHYMDASISGQSQCFTVWAHFGHFGDGKGDDFYDSDHLELVAFTSIVHHFGQRRCGSKEIDFREHRTVVLPSFQGLGFGSRIGDGIGEYLSRHGLRLHSKTAHPRYGKRRDCEHSPWIPAPSNGETKKRAKWTNNFQRVLWGKESALGQHQKEKTFAVHMFMLSDDEERTPAVQRRLDERVIVTRKYKKLQ